MLRNRPLPGAGSPWCLRCWRRPAAWESLVCERCAGAARARRLRRRRGRVAGRWIGARLLDGLIGVGAGALALLPLAGANGRVALGLSIAALLLLLVLATTTALAHAWMLRPIVRRWGWWAAVDGVELALHWLLVLVALFAVGHSPPLIAAITALSGAAAALAQSHALTGQAAAPWRWAVASALVWLGAAGAVLAWGLAASGPLLAVIGGAAVGRVVHGLLAGPILGRLLVPQAADEARQR